ncbi:MAG: permease-like cell division protein FtsX [Patescibacteria group bacterium]
MQLFLRVIKTSWQGFWRNGWLSLVAIFIMVQVLLLVGIFLSLNVGVGQAIQTINNQIDVAVFFKEYVPAADITSFQAKSSVLDNIKSIQFVSQEEALAKYVASSQYNQELIEAIDGDASFFPASLEVKVVNPDLLEQVIKQIKEQDTNGIIATTSWEKSQEIVGKLREINKLLALGNVGISLILFIVALLIIFNTIRITIFTRKEEIEIMKLVGATDWYIRWPFVLEGVLYGFIGALIAFGLTILMYQSLVWFLGSSYWSWQSVSKTVGDFGYLFAVRLFVSQLFFGILVGSVSSYLSTKRYLRI